MISSLYEILDPWSLMMLIGSAFWLGVDIAFPVKTFLFILPGWLSYPFWGAAVGIWSYNLGDYARKNLR